MPPAGSSACALGAGAGTRGPPRRGGGGLSPAGRDLPRRGARPPGLGPALSGASSRASLQTRADARLGAPGASPHPCLKLEGPGPFLPAKGFPRRPEVAAATAHSPPPPAVPLPCKGLFGSPRGSRGTSRRRGRLAAPPGRGAECGRAGPSPDLSRGVLKAPRESQARWALPAPPGCRLGPGTKRERQRGEGEKEGRRPCGFYLSSDDRINKLSGSASVWWRGNIGPR